MTNNKPTIYDIKYRTQEKQPFFFDRKTLKFFHQTMKDFKVKKSPFGRIFIQCPIRNEKRNIIGYTFKEFINNNELITVRDDNNNIFDDRMLISMACYIQSH